MKSKLSVVWLRRDLRLHDHAALSFATNNSESVAVVFVFDIKILEKLKNKSDKRISFIYDSLLEIDSKLKEKGSQLIIKIGDPKIEIPKIVKSLKVDSIYFNEDYESYAINRDNAVKRELEREGIEIHTFKDHVIFSGSEILKPNGDPYQVFTPYKKAWLTKITKNNYENFKIKNRFLDQSILKKHSTPIEIKKLGFHHVSQSFKFQQPGVHSGQKALKNFLKYMPDYHEKRDFPADLNGTSGISVHLRFGTLSIRECLRACMSFKGEGANTWLSELIWRDFYSMILFNYPHVEKECFKGQYNNLNWENSKPLFKAWCEGKTGFPIVDAGMRQLNKTGWMHNRVRMIVASFLVKDLLIDWRKGEKYFSEKLLDFDLASNNGGWQWSASTGCDAQPYFRIFNPSLQSKRFDPDAEYIKKWVPELANSKVKDIHDPENSSLYESANYVKPVITHASQKHKALMLFKGNS